jgi:hypothetical protein
VAQYCKAIIDLEKFVVSDLMTTNSATYGVRIYDSDDTAWTTFKTVAEAPAFTYTIDEPSYEFGDFYEFDENPSDDDIFNESSSFAMSDYITDAEGTGFMKVTGGFTVIPNFETVLWYFKFSVDMPTEYFNTENVMYASATFTDSDDTNAEPITVTCAV